MKKIKEVCNGIWLTLVFLSYIFAPWVVLVSSILSAVDYYAVGSSVIYGIWGFFVGGTLASISMIVFVLLLGAIGYYTNK